MASWSAGGLDVFVCDCVENYRMERLLRLLLQLLGVIV